MSGALTWPPSPNDGDTFDRWSYDASIPGWVATGNGGGGGGLTEPVTLSQVLTATGGISMPPWTLSIIGTNPWQDLVASTAGSGSLDVASLKLSSLSGRPVFNEPLEILPPLRGGWGNPIQFLTGIATTGGASGGSLVSIKPTVSGTWHTLDIDTNGAGANAVHVHDGALEYFWLYDNGNTGKLDFRGDVDLTGSLVSNGYTQVVTSLDNQEVLWVSNNAASGMAANFQASSATLASVIVGNQGGGPGLSVEDGGIRVGAPTGPAVPANSLNVQGGLYINGVAAGGGGGGGIPEPATAGSFLRTNTGTWVPGMPTSGTVSLPAALTLTTGTQFDLVTLSAWINNPLLTIYNYSTAAKFTTGTAGTPTLLLINSGGGDAIKATGDIDITGRYLINGVPLQTGGGGSGLGVTDGSNAAAGYVGEVLQLAGTIQVTYASGAGMMIGQLDLTAGDWEVCGVITGPQNAVTPTALAAWTAITTSATPGFPSDVSLWTGGVVGNSANLSLALAVTRWNVSVPTSIYLHMFGVAAVSNVTFTRRLTARRMR